LPVPIFKVDAFASKPFSGNPAGVCILSSRKDKKWMQNIAREMNVSETAFLLKRDDRSYDMRWFTPATEVKLCGHATLASSHILWETGSIEREEEARFHTASGLLIARRIRDNWIELDFPSKPERKASKIPTNLLKALRLNHVKYVGTDGSDYLVEVESEKIVRNLRPNFPLLRSVPCRGVIVTSASPSKPYDFVSRFFAPKVGIDEDPVTGSAHCYLGPYWKKKLGKSEFLAYQASARGGAMRVRVGDDGRRVYLGGKAVTILHGSLSESL